MTAARLDRDKLCERVRQLSEADVRALIERAIGLLPAPKLAKLIEDGCDFSHG